MGFLCYDVWAELDPNWEFSFCVWSANPLAPGARGDIQRPNVEKNRASARKRRPPRWGVRTYLFLVLSLMAAVPALLLGILHAQHLAEAEVEQAERGLAAAGQALSVQLDLVTRGYVRAVEDLAAQVESSKTLEPGALDEMMAAHHARHSEFYGWYIADARGVSLLNKTRDPAKSPHGIDYSDREYFKRAKATRQVAVSPVRVGKVSGVPNIQIAAPILDRDGRFLGIAEGSVALDSMVQLARSAARGIGDGRVVVVDGTGRLLVDSESAGATKLTNLGHDPLYQAGAVNAAVYRGTDDRGRGVHAVVKRLGGSLFDWRVVVARPSASLREQARIARWYTAVVTLLALLAALAVAALLAAWLAKPIRSLADAAVEIAGGSSFAPSPGVDSGPKELAKLGVAIERMVKRLQNDADELEKQVDARTLELKQANTELEVLATALHHAGDAIEICDADAKFLFVNPAFEKLTGYRKEEVLGRTPGDLLRTGEYDDVFYRRMREEAARGSFRGTFFSRKKDGTPFEQMLTLTAVRDRRGKVTEYVAVRRDLTQLRSAQEAARVSDRMASVGTLAAGLAHEINNPLTYVLANLTSAVEALERSSPESPAETELLDELRSTLADAREGAERMHDTIEDLKTFSRSDDEKMGPIDVNRVIESAVKIVNNQIRHRAQLVCNLQPIPLVYGNVGKLGQVFVHVLVNAAQATPEGAAPANQIRIRTSSSDGVVKVDISDTGSGMPRDVLARAFDPFFTTKEVGEGSGLGLSVCHNIVTAMGGAIDAHSQPGEGTRLQIVLPASEEQLSEQEPTVTRTRAKRLHAHVLIVDDEPQVRKSIARILRDCQVDHAENGAVALERMRTQRYDVVFCDLMMPDVTGMDLYERVQSRFPAQAKCIVFMTGGPFTKRARRFADRQDVKLMAKPFSNEEVRALVDKSVRRRQAG